MTRDYIRSLAKQAGLEPSEAEYICNLSARARHRARVLTVEDVIRALWRGADGELDPQPSLIAATAAVEALACGYIPQALREGLRELPEIPHPPFSHRPFPFSDLGAGRRQALDGPAWTAAVCELADSATFSPDELCRAAELIFDSNPGLSQGSDTILRATGSLAAAAALGSEAAREAAEKLIEGLGRWRREDEAARAEEGR